MRYAIVFILGCLASLTIYIYYLNNKLHSCEQEQENHRITAENMQTNLNKTIDEYKIKTNALQKQLNDNMNKTIQQTQEIKLDDKKCVSVQFFDTINEKK